MKKLIVFLLTALLFSVTSFAYDDLITNESSPSTHEQGWLEGCGNIVYLTAGDTFDKDSEKQELADDTTNLRIPLRARYSPIENLEAFVIVPIVSMDAGGESESGIGDIWLGAKYSVLENGLLTLRGALNLGTGDDEKGLGNAGGFGIDIGALTSKMFIEDKLAGFGQAGIRYAGEDGDTKLQPGLGIYAAGYLGYIITEQTWIMGGLELMTFGESKFDGNDVTDSNVMDLDLLVGVHRVITETFSGRISLDYTLTGTNTSADLGVIIAAYYGF